MTSSLVGSEMCIRDRAGVEHRRLQSADKLGPNNCHQNLILKGCTVVPVSYTHLTLPTICSV
eukprot:7386585-Prorocentrum_lima.AAC.1